MKEEFKIVGVGIVIVICLVGLAFVFELGGLKWSEYFAPQHADVARKVFEKGKSYSEAKAQDLIRYRMQYMNAPENEKTALAFMIRDAYADFDADSLRSAQSREFLKNIMNGGL